MKEKNEKVMKKSWEEITGTKVGEKHWPRGKQFQPMCITEEGQCVGEK